MVVAGLSMTACNMAPNAAGGAKKPAAKAPPSPYSAIANGKVDVEGGIIEVAARSAGVVKDVYVQEGDHVTKDEVLARQDDQSARLAVMSARAAVLQAQSGIDVISVNIATAKREYARLVKLQATTDVAVQKVDQAKDAVDQSEASLKQQQAVVETTKANLAQAEYSLDQTLVRSPSDGRIIRRYANPGSGASTLNVSTMFDLEPTAPRIIRAEIVESSIPDVAVGQEVEIVPEADSSKLYVGTVKRIAATFGSRKLKSDSANEASDERVVEVVVTADGFPFLIGQRVLVKFMKPGEKAGIVRKVAMSSSSSAKP